MSIIKCPLCKERNKESALFCAACGEKLVQKCSNCQNEMSWNARFCDQCGTRLISPVPGELSTSEKILDSSKDKEGAERRHLTVMFCDLADSTKLSQLLDAEDLRGMIKEYQDVCSEIVQQNGGHIAQYLGDGILIYFGYPKAFEDSAHRALRSGLEILESLHHLNLSLDKTYNTVISLRIAIHSGVVVVGEMGSGKRREQLAMGQVPNIAARLEKFANKNSIIISQDTYRLVHKHFDCSSLGTIKLKGVKEEMSTYRVAGEKTTKSRFYQFFQKQRNTLVGREAEITYMYGLWDNAKEGYGQALFVNGEAGIGKSRLLFEFKENVSKDNNYCLIDAQCSQHHCTRSLHPIIESFEYAVFQLDSTSSISEKLQKLEKCGHHNGFNLKDFIPLIAPYLSIVIPEKYPPLTIDPEQRKSMVFQLLLKSLHKQTNNKTLLFVVEDLHWADPFTLDFLSIMVDHVANKKILLLFTYRPEFKTPWLTGVPHFNHMELSRLKPRQIKQLIRPLTSEKALPEKIQEQLIQKTDGIPLFIEEWTRMILESDMVEEKETSFQLKKNFSEHSIPSTLHDSLMARLDKLGPGKKIAQIGSVMGREFNLFILESCSHFSKQALYLALNKLVGAQIFSERENSQGKTYIFKHALIQEVAYHSLLRSDRKHYHHLVGEAMEEAFESHFSTNPENIASHFAEADFPKKAIEYWKKAAILANKKYATLEEIEYLSRGLSQIPKIEDSTIRKQTELNLLLLLGPAYLDAKGYNSTEVEETYLRAEKLCSEIGTEAQMFSILYGLYLSYSLRTNFSLAQNIIDKMLVIATNSKKEKHALVAHHLGGFQAFFLGKYKMALMHVLSVLKIYRKERDAFLSKQFGHDLGVFSHCFAARALWTLGYPDQSLQHIQSALTLAADLDQPFSLAIAHKLAASIYKLRREPKSMLHHANMAVAISKKHNFDWVYSVGLIWKASAITSLKGPSEGLPLFEKAFNLIKRFKNLQGTPHYLTFYAEAHIMCKDYLKAEETIKKALSIIADSKECWYHAELYRLKANVLVEKGNCALAEKAYLKSIQIARKQNAKSWELRTSKDLAVFSSSCGKNKKALNRLTKIHGSFSEGFKTKELLESAALINKLNSKTIII